jgi:excinuclease UvrABC ATPase subunit
MFQEYIEIRGARENNLKNISLCIPKRKITIFTGVSGSGKSSIVFDTIATESQRLRNENFSMFVRSFLPKYAQLDADAIENLSMSIVVDQKHMGDGSHSTVGTVTDINTIVGHLMQVIDRLVDTGNTVVVIEHNLHVITNADWIIDMGPEGGHKGGQVIFQGTPKELLSATQSLTSVHLGN